MKKSREYTQFVRAMDTVLRADPEAVKAAMAAIGCKHPDVTIRTVSHLPALSAVLIGVGSSGSVQ